jgi:hypothetical protein
MKHWMISVAATITLVTTSLALGDPGDQLAKLLPADGAPADLFGNAVAIDGNLAVVGAQWDANDLGVYAGAAYIFDVSDPANPVQVAKIVPDGGFAGDQFGNAVAICGTTVAVGAAYAGDQGYRSGAAYIYDVSEPANPIQVVKLTAADGAPEEYFGYDVAVSETRVLVGALFDDDNGEQSGSAYLFDAATGEQLHKLFPANPLPLDHFGTSVDIDGDLAVVGGYGDFYGTTFGLACVFNAGTGERLHALVADDAVPGDWFGVSVGISGMSVVVGASHRSDNGVDSGAAYVFDAGTGEQRCRLSAADNAAGDRFGNQVDLAGDVALVTAIDDDDAGEKSGSAYLFDASTGDQLAKLLASDGAAGDLLGYAAALTESVAILGARDDDDNGDASGSAYLFDAAPAGCEADLDGDGDTDLADLGILLASYLLDGGGDLDGDGDTDLADLGVLLAEYGCGV